MAASRTISSLNRRLPVLLLSKRSSTMAAVDIIPHFPLKRPAGIEPPREFASLRLTDPVAKVKLFDDTPAWLATKHHDNLCSLLSTSRPYNRAYIQKPVDDLSDKMKAKGCADGPIDLIEQFALPIIYTILGVPFEDLEFLAKQNSIRTNGSSTAREASSANEELLRYLTNLVEARSKEPKDDLVNKLVTEQVKPGKLDKADAVQIAFLLLVAGNATMMNMIALGVVTLFQYTTQLAELKVNPDATVSGFVNELCRYHTTSAMAMRRVAKEDVFPNADEFYMHRKSSVEGEEPLGFGHEEHRCIAEHPAKAELRTICSATLFNKCLLGV
ncbi:cytochrome P450 [Bombardia bombarda]|uniref:Cytochrome P450 n=1 Tax=Bombardia bombarda TaxID=252184 RepID=A0AA39TK03_9PEZI|nr:cytochrome P450 [Bombardia bombarda]